MKKTKKADTKVHTVFIATELDDAVGSSAKATTVPNPKIIKAQIEMKKYLVLCKKYLDFGVFILLSFLSNFL